MTEWCRFVAMSSLGLLTRNNSLDFELSQAKYSQKKLFNTLIRNFGYCGNYSPLAAMQISSGNPSMSNNTQVITLDTFKKFLDTRQMESKSDGEIKAIIEVSRASFDVMNHSTLIYPSAAPRTRSVFALRESSQLRGLRALHDG